MGRCGGGGGCRRRCGVAGWGGGWTPSAWLRWTGRATAARRGRGERSGRGFGRLIAVGTRLWWARHVGGRADAGGGWRVADRAGAGDAANGGGAGLLLQLSGVVCARRDGLRGRAGVLGAGGRRAGRTMARARESRPALLGEASQACGVLRRRAAPDAAGDGHRLQAGGADSRGRARGEGAGDWAEERLPDRRGGQRGDGVAARNAGAAAAAGGGIRGVAVRPGEDCRWWWRCIRG